jgi:nucleotide-binding universal stress UspA family protein
MPKPISTIVAATDFSFAAHRAARRAGLLAKAHAASLQLLHVIDSVSAKTLVRGSPGSHLEERVRLEAKRALDSLADDVSKATGVVATPSAREDGGVMNEILATAEHSYCPRAARDQPVARFLVGLNGRAHRTEGSLSDACREAGATNFL